MASGDDVLGGALNRALRRPLLSAEEERRLARRAATGDLVARDRLIEGHVRLVASIARGYGGRGVAFADLVQEGMMGMLRAVERFDPGRGHRLATYASWWVRRAMLEAITVAPSIRIPAESNRELAAILRTERDLSGRGRRRPDAATLARSTGVSVRRVERLRSAARVVTSLDVEVAGSDTTLVELLADPAAQPVTAGLDRDETRRAVRAAMALLAPRVRSVLELRFGLEGGRPETHEEIGRVLGITAERSRQIEAEGLRRLRPLAERASLAA
jgi:RNA polymerase sigma factor (sigma-70 family)